jgi:hypothetical protein
LPDVAICGSTDATGAVLPTAAATIRQKVLAAAGAGFRRFILPAENLADAAAEIETLSRRLPEVPIPRLVPARHLSDLLASPEITTASSRPVRRLVHRSRRIPVAMAIVLFLLLTTWILFLMPRPWRAERTTTEIRGERKQFVVTRLSGFPPRERQWRFESPVVAAIAADLSPVCRTALLVGTGESGLTPARLLCYDFSSGRLLWEKDFTRPAPLPPATMLGNRTHVSEMITTDLDGDGFQDIILIVFATPQSPCFVFWLGPEGAQRAMYAHRGYLFRATAEDLRVDGTKELFLTGTSNSDDQPYSQRATLVVLDQHHFSGWPEGGPFTGSSIAPFDSCLARVIFPPIPEHCVIYDAAGYNVGRFVPCPSPTDPRIIIRVGPVEYPGLTITLDGDFRPIQVLAEDGLYGIVHRAIQSGRINDDFTTMARLLEYQGRIRRVR